jgi:hypothetical protein
MSRASSNRSDRPPISSRLQRALSAVVAADASVPSGELLAWLGQPLDLHSASELAGVLAAAPPPATQEHRNTVGACEDCEEALLTVRGGLLRDIARSFAAAEGALIPLPRLDAPSVLDGPDAAERLRRFHAAWQREMELRIHALRRDLRSCLQQQAPGLGALAALDEALEQQVLRAGESVLVSLPALLVPRWETLVADTADAAASELLVSELRELLLAELEQRLQPALGLVEACVVYGNKD